MVKQGCAMAPTLFEQHDVFVMLMDAFQDCDTFFLNQETTLMASYSAKKVATTKVQTDVLDELLDLC